MAQIVKETNEAYFKIEDSQPFTSFQSLEERDEDEEESVYTSYKLKDKDICLDIPKGSNKNLDLLYTEDE